MPLVFDRFRQGDSSTTREHGGLGLGLAIVRHLVELHGGIVKARSEGADRGAEFTVELPISATVQTDVEREHRVDSGGVGRGIGTTPSLSGLRVLIVDDDADAREMISMILAQAGAEVAAAANVPQAVDLIDRWNPEVLVSDVGMPGEDGYDLIRKVRERPSENRGQIPALALTAFVRTQDRLKTLSSGYQMHLPKPIVPIELVTVVASLAKRL